MNQIEFIGDQWRRAYAGEAWHGPSLQEILAGVTAEQALARPIADGHCIWELTMHIGVWMSAARRRLAGDTVQPTPQEDWPLIDGGSPVAWQQTLAALQQEHAQLQAAICSLPESSLENQTPGENYSLAFLLHGVVQHNLYHAGQIALLKKAL
ncbi:MAG TPA: DinB family protein [Bryobacteraceae bacterium]|nr:DinB family protein [Bryobacteraceae bacterium]